MKKLFSSAIKPVINSLGFDLVRSVPNGRADSVPQDFSELDRRIFEAVSPYTMTSPERVKALVDSVRYLNSNGIEGAFVECGVWKGGSSMAMALALLEQGTSDRELWLYDTYTGMSAPGDEDVSIDGENAHVEFTRTKTSEDSSDWCRAGIDEVRKNVLSTGYPEELLRFVAGKVEETIPGEAPQKISLLRLDTDWYESTRHELIHLYPRLSEGGILIIDDYGHWAGAQKAVDEFIAENSLQLFLSRVDYTCRIAVK